ncbi:TetR family transcriptional regulator [Lolliginicoccus suaedae]|uniref:TetR family transcriptional regulator n=1 Tax=Lolliginicoccus suaedae TaxID=2605429 RepID=UPI0011EBB30A|nr:TetR family transcriptional regulator [Lolliginicoccus suaedae]
MPNTSDDAPRPYPEQARELLVDVVLDSADRLIRAGGWARTRMEAIAQASGVSKPTLYRVFGTREQLASAYLDREVDRLTGVIRGALPGPAHRTDDPVGTVRGMLVLVLEALSDNPIVKAILTEDSSAASLLPLLTVHGDRLLERAAARMVELSSEWLPEIAEPDRRVLADTIIRLLLSYSVLPGRSIEDTADTIIALVRPFLEQALAS